MTIKYTCLTVFILFLGFLAKAQIKKGSILLGGIVRYENHKSEAETSTSKSRDKQFDIGPAAAIAIQDNLLIGIELGYSNRKNSSESNYTDVVEKHHGYYANAMIRKYWNITSKFYAFAHGSAGYGWSNGKAMDEKNNDVLRKTKYWVVNATLVPGIAYSVSRKVQLESTFLPLLSINYGKQKTDYLMLETRSVRNNFSVSSSLANAQQFSLGIRFLLEK